MGKTPMQTVMQKDTMTDSFMNRLLNLLPKYIDVARGYNNYFKAKFEEAYCQKFGVQEFDVNSQLAKGGKDAVIFLYDFIEFLAEFTAWAVATGASMMNSRVPHRFVSEFNDVFEAEKSAYRFANNFKLISIVDQTEFEAINDAMKASEPYSAVYESLERARKYFSDRSNPDYKTSIFHSVKAIEAACKSISGKDNATLGQILNDKDNPLHPAFKGAIEKLYGFANEADIRHAKINPQGSVGEHEARFVLITSHSIVNYLISKQEIAT